MLENLVAFVAVSAVVICTPGQDTALTIRNTLAGRRRGGIATAAGVSAGQLVWTVAASAGIVALLSSSEPVFRALKLAGAAYLVYLGLLSLWSAFAARHRPEALSSTRNSATRSTGMMPPRAFRQGLLSNLGNPKMALFFASLLPQFAPSGSASFLVLLALGVLFCAMTFAWLALYTLAIARARSLLGSPVRRALDAITGVVLVAFGVRLATER